MAGAIETRFNSLGLLSADHPSEGDTQPSLFSQQKFQRVLQVGMAKFVTGGL